MFALGSQAYGFDSFSIAHVNAVIASSCLHAAFAKNAGVGGGACGGGKLEAIEADGDAQDLTGAKGECALVTGGLSNQVDEDNCIAEEVQAFDQKGEFTVVGYKFGQRNNTDTTFAVITKLITRLVRGALEVYCGTNGQSSYLYSVTSNSPNICNSGFCSTTFGTGNVCRTNCDSLATANCGGGCDLNSVTCETNCGSLSGACVQDCSDYQANGLFCANGNVATH